MNQNNAVNGNGDSGENKAKSQIFAILCAALVIIVVAAVFIIDKISEDEKMNKQAQQISDHISSSLDSNQKEASEIKEKLNTGLAGTYKSVGYSNEATIELHNDGTLTVVSTGEKGWWTSSAKSGIDIVGLIFQNTSEPVVYQVYGSRLVDTQSVYIGDVTAAGNSEVAMTLGAMTVTLRKDGKAEGRFTQTVEQDGVEIPYSEAYGGSYVIDGEYIDLTLNGDSSRFLIMDYEDESIPDGMASLYYEKIS